MPVYAGTRRALLYAPVFSPLEIDGLQLWLKADAGLYTDSAKTAQAVSDADVIGAWADQSGNGNDATQATTAKKPLLKLNIVNGKPVVRFDGTDDWLTLGDLEAHSNATGLSFFCVRRADSAETNKSVISKYDPAASQRQWQWAVGAWNVQDDPDSYNTDNVVAISDVSGAHILTGIWSPGVLSQGFIDGASLGTAITPATDIGDTDEPLLISALADGTEWFTNSDIAEIVIYNTALSAADRQRVEQYLAAKYGITLS